MGYLLIKDLTKDKIQIRDTLHSYQLSFKDPDSNEMLNFNAPMHQDMENLIKIFKKHI